MNLKLLFMINDEEKKLIKIVNKFSLPFNTLMYGEGTASQGILDFLGLNKTTKNILFSIIPDYLGEEIINYLREDTKINDIGKGIAFTVLMASSPKYIRDAFNYREGVEMEKINYHLIVTIASEGSSEKIMNVAKRAGANGGTLIKGRGIGGKNSFKLFNVTMEPEKDVVLIVCKDENKDKIMSSILNKSGMNTEYKGMCFSLPIDSTAGFGE